MNHNDDAGPLVLLNSGSEYLKNYEKSIENWIDLFVEDQKQHVLNVSRSSHGGEADKGGRSGSADATVSRNT